MKKEKYYFGRLIKRTLITDGIKTYAEFIDGTREWIGTKYIETR